MINLKFRIDRIKIEKKVHMSTRIIFIAVSFISFKLFVDQITSDVSCSFQNSTSHIVFKKLKIELVK